MEVACIKAQVREKIKTVESSVLQRLRVCGYLFPYFVLLSLLSTVFALFRSLAALKSLPISTKLGPKFYFHHIVPRELQKQTIIENIFQPVSKYNILIKA